MMLPRLAIGLLNVVAVVNLGATVMQQQLGSAAPSDDQVVTWLIRGAISVLFLLTSWMFKQAVQIVRDLRRDTDDHEGRILVLETLNGIEPRKENRGLAARRRPSSSPQTE